MDESSDERLLDSTRIGADQVAPPLTELAAPLHPAIKIVATAMANAPARILLCVDGSWKGRDGLRPSTLVFAHAQNLQPDEFWASLEGTPSDDPRDGKPSSAPSPMKGTHLVDNDTVPAFGLSLIHISEPTRRTPISYAVF